MHRYRALFEEYSIRVEKEPEDLVIVFNGANKQTNSLITDRAQE